MKDHVLYKNLLRMLMALALGLGANLAQATASYDALANASLTIDTITNQTNPGNMSGLSITGNAWLVNEGNTIIGNAAATYNGVIDIQDSTAASPGWLHQDSDAHGNADNPPKLSIADSNHSSAGVFTFSNGSATDTYQIDFALVYNVSASAGLTRVLGERAYAEAFVRLIDSLLQVDFDNTRTADALGILSPINDSDGGTLIFSILLAPNDVDSLSLNVSAQGNAEAVPEPSSGFLLGVGLIGLIAASSRRLGLPLSPSMG